MHILLHDIRLPALSVVGGEQEVVAQALARRLDIGADDFTGGFRIVKRALDARKRGDPAFVYSVVLENLEPALGQHIMDVGNGQLYTPAQPTGYRFAQVPDDRPVVIGAGPAGLFAALTLAEAGWPPLIVERGQSVDERPRSVARLYAHGELNPESNVCFGEGGAGTFSDGKLYTRIGDARVEFLLRRLVEFGAPAAIEVNTRPHVGTDKLIGVLKRLRRHLVGLGAEFRFNERLTRLSLNSARTAVQTVHTDSMSLPCQAVLLATGHSARDVWTMLSDLPAVLQCRPIAVGYRVEHPQELIDEARYGFAHRDRGLPAADYRLRHNESAAGRGIYSFCMCPGGVVVATPTSAGALVTNGMSHASRSGKYANSALVVTLRPQDYSAGGGAEAAQVFAGVAFQDKVERAAYQRGGGAFVAPALRLDDYLNRRVSANLPTTSYRRGLRSVALDGLYPDFVDEALRDAVRLFDRRLRGFVSTEAKIIGVETRTASPIRVVRREDGQAENIDGLYPVGEGMGYGGGIVSAAIDGIRSAQALLQRRGAAVYLGTK